MPGRKDRLRTMKVYLMLGFHASFYHSWRGDTPDEAGFGTDIRVVRHILRTLDEANAKGRRARGYWDFDVYWTLEEIVPHHAPDIIEGIRRRVGAGLDEIVLGPYNNGANHAATERELRAATAYAFENPYGSGLRQVFGRTTTLLRPQESMYTAGQNTILMDEGISGLVIYYSGVPFNALSTFIPALSPEQRYNHLWLRARPEEPPIELWPCISTADLVEDVSLEALLLKLRRLQTSGQVDTDLLLHLNFDADAETWLPVGVPRAFSWFPNTGGLGEYIDVVERYPWAEFTVPSEYAQDHLPQGEVLVRQDLADGGFDGNYSWAEKYSSQRNWTALEASRLHSYRAEALARLLPEAEGAALRRRLWEGVESPFFWRLVGLSCTHFGMSTPVINEARQARAEGLLGRARDGALEAEREAAALFVRERTASPARPAPLYAFEVIRPLNEWGRVGAARSVVRVPIILPAGVEDLQLDEAGGEQVAASLLDVRSLRDGRLAGELVFAAEFEPRVSRRYEVRAAAAEGSEPQPRSQRLHRLENQWLALELSAETGIASLTFEGQAVGGRDFLAPFITYGCGERAQRWTPHGYTLEALNGELWNGLSRARLAAQIVMETPHGPATSELVYTFTLSDELPYLILDVEVNYARTRCEDEIQNVQQQLRRLLDLGWVEVAPCQLQPGIVSGPERPLRVWKHNYLGVTSYYDLDYWRINSRNRELDSFNHQVTAGWVALSDGVQGLLLGENAGVLASMAFCPMRLRERDGKQRVGLNPFGSYYGRQLDYRHLGGNGLGAEFTAAVSGSLRPNGPSFNGQLLAFSLMLAPYHGDEPPVQLQADALAHFYPPGVVYTRTPEGVEALLPEDLRCVIEEDQAEKRREALRGLPLPPPEALATNPTAGAVDLVWVPPRDERITGYEVRVREAGDDGWQNTPIAVGARWQAGGLQDGVRYAFQVRAIAPGLVSRWTEEVEVVPGAVEATSISSLVPGGSPWSLARIVVLSLASVVRARLGI